ncbi:aerobic-type carbon monoxide dehydrogenase, middle subunit CoxM/CutM-like protein [Terriglobus roseus DSM 18391]|uniref:Aerobic-type carbon monoxide dehydrogenase, middle subunit CoxM/CutM-like protein n=1 Tax=Terriglobus roseus (strain DSM 18391 / NRRL B-41598 / KBS 63) TaxID=926566 RepID=I3ZH67_TERRK|nr:xanthine dehydrogenase family protein subunit M [Terriglobus roseus]AFL88244.1 aerobic-type carbon monoxide dehydrogenase, middle subunit CoxM/CutM-like protein [Terriglobus roseus DSM 18391]AFL88585.1 aerobic-type carbon monoxide dehydrogenase, middle subunit CoxM/CutM-like protein [Terriglobus roseus DSM 18391]
MNPFAYERATAPEGAVHSLAADKNAKLLGGGTNLVDLMKQDVERPSTLIDITRLSALAHIEAVEGGHRVGALVRNSDLANDGDVRKTYPLLSQALLAGASAQLRNLATTGGNLMQRTRCYYFYDSALPACNKRAPGSGCGAVEGFNRVHAVLGQTDEGPAGAHTCIATNPSDMNVALAALHAVVEISGPKGKRTMPVREFHRLVGKTPQLDTNLQHDELITGVHLPASAAKFAANSYYLKARDRQSYAFALVSVAAGLEMDGGSIKSVALALGGVAHKPWTSEAAEKAMIGKPATEETFKAAAAAAMQGAKGYEHNAFKIELAKSCIVRAFTLAAQGTGNHGAEGAAA